MSNTTYKPAITMDTYPVLIINKLRPSANSADKDDATRTGSESSISPQTSDESHFLGPSHMQPSICDICNLFLASRSLQHSSAVVSGSSEPRPHPPTDSPENMPRAVIEIAKEIRNLYIDDEKLLHGAAILPSTTTLEPLNKRLDYASLLSESDESSLQKKGVHFHSDTKLSGASNHAHIRKSRTAHAHYTRFEADANAFIMHIAHNPPHPGRYSLSHPEIGINFSSSRAPAGESEHDNSASSAEDVEKSTETDMKIMFDQTMFNRIARINRGRDTYALHRGELKETKKSKSGDGQAYRARGTTASPLRWSQD